MLSTTRRSLLQMGCLGTSIGLAGCAEFLDRSDDTRLTFLLFENWTGEEQRISVRIGDGTESLYSTTVSLEPHSTKLVPPDSVDPDGYPTEPGVFDIEFDLHGRDDERGEAHFDLGEYDDECVGYTAEVSPERTDDTQFELSVFPATGCEQGDAGETPD